MKKAVAFAKQSPWYAAGVTLVVILTLWFFFFRGGEVTQDTFAVTPSEFLQQVSVSGKVVAAQEVDLGFAQGGRVSRVYVTVGRTVSQGTLLAEVENSDLRAAVSQREAALQTQEAKLASLKAGTRPEEIVIAQAAVDRDSRSLIDDIREAYAAADDAVRNTVDLFMSNPRTNPQVTFLVSDTELKASVEQKRLQIEAVLSAWQDSNLSLATSPDLSAAATSAKNNLVQVTSLLSDANAALNRAISTQSTSQTTIDSYISAVAAARISVNTANAGVTAGFSALDASKKNLLLKQAGSTPQDIAAQEAQVRAAQADVQNAYAQLQKTLITAPFTGVVTVVDAKAGKIVSSNSPEISMISAGTYQIESFVPEINISLLKVGDRADTTLDAYGETVIFPASVVSLDPAETVRDGVSTYRALLQFDQKDERIKTGMTANIVITTDRREGVLQVPQGAVKEEAGAKYVTVLVGETEERRTVTTGSVSSLGSIEILSGLQSGDVVVLPSTP